MFWAEILGIYFKYIICVLLALHEASDSQLLSQCKLLGLRDVIFAYVLFYFILFQ
jgi:hypothetical protein